MKNLVDNPDEVGVEVVEGNASTIVEVKVCPDDVAKVVGRQGRTIKALRTIAMTIGARMGRRVKLEIMDS
ncbi:MAG: KH domain-containing protein [Simkaniaceae bacterium]|nr:KH domain-containing protein [Simkaniaceae bacterium]